VGGSGYGAVEMAIVGEELARPGLDIAGGYGLNVLAGLNLVLACRAASLVDAGRLGADRGGDRQARRVARVPGGDGDGDAAVRRLRLHDGVADRALLARGA